MRKYIIQTFKIEEPRGYDHWVRFFLNGFLPSKFCEGGGIAELIPVLFMESSLLPSLTVNYILYEIKRRKERCLILSTLAGVLVARFGNTCYRVLYTQHVYLLKLEIKKPLRITFLSWHLLSLAKAYCATRHFTFKIFTNHNRVSLISYMYF